MALSTYRALIDGRWHTRFGYLWRDWACTGVNVDSIFLRSTISWFNTAYVMPIQHTARISDTYASLVTTSGIEQSRNEKINLPKSETRTLEESAITIVWTKLSLKFVHVYFTIHSVSKCTCNTTRVINKPISYQQLIVSLLRYYVLIYAYFNDQFRSFKYNDAIS